MRLPSIIDIKESHNVIKNKANITPIVNHKLMDDIIGSNIYFKMECFQITGSFKFRGAYNHISRLDINNYPGGIVACSTGNHAQGVAMAAKIMGYKANIFMPKDSPKIKMDRVRKLGAEITPFDRDDKNISREELADKFAFDNKAALVSPYDDFYIIAGQGTAGLEIAYELFERNIKPDYMLIPASGGGLSSGCAVAMKHFYKDCKIYTVEPEGFDDHKLSLDKGERLSNDKLSGSICDALLAPTPGEITFEINNKLLSGGLTATDYEVREAIKLAYYELKVVLEPAGAIALAALMNNYERFKGKNVVVMCSGGNIDPTLFCEIINS